MYETSSSQVVDPANLIDGWEVVIGLEVHTELATNTKIFCGCANRFGDEPNTNVCPVCLGLPGSLPVLNRQAVELAMRLGAAVGCTINDSIFHRKNYFYPDMPKDYQVSQYDLPINTNGFLDLPSGKRIGIERAHLEEDTGKSTHIGGETGRIHGSSHSLVDYNRAGVPLLEIVSKPDLRSSEEARQYVSELREVLTATGVSDAKMEEGSMRVDVNVSVHRPGTEFGTRCEIKNVNSVRALGRAIEYEARRQILAIDSGEKIVQQTRHWDDAAGRTHTLRVKENADDYRYFPEPDLVLIAPGDAWRNAVRAALPELPAARRFRVAAALGGSPSDVTAQVLVERGRDALLHEAIAAGADPARVAVHLEHNCPQDGPRPLSVNALVGLSKLELSGAVTATQAKAIVADLIDAGGDGDPVAIADAKGYKAMDSDVLESAVDAAIAAQPEAWAKYLAGDPKVAGAFVGAVMKATKGQADGKAVTASLERRRSAS